jgi:hypothetical protein
MAQLPAKKRATQTEKDQKLYTLDVSIMSGPMTESFLKKNKELSIGEIAEWR